MKKINKQLIINLIIIIFLGITIFSEILIKETTNLDEIWNYNTAKCISNGLIPYKDISMITTPLLPMITALIFNLTYKGILISRILAMLIGTMILFITYKIFNILLNKRWISFMIIEILEIIYIEYFCIDYNFLIVLIVLMMLYQELKNIEKLNADKIKPKNNKIILKYDFFIGILAGLAICTKQTVGCTIGLLAIAQPIINGNIKEIKQETKNILSRILGIILPIIILFIYLLYFGAISEFINYAILGIKEFTNKISYISLFSNNNYFIKYASITLPIILIALIVYLAKNKKENKKLLTLLIYSISTLIIVYPISDDIHFMISNYILLISSIYAILKLLQKSNEKIKFKEKKYIYITIASYLIIFCTYTIVNKTIKNYQEYKNNKNINYEISDFKYLSTPQYLMERIKNIDSVVKQNDSKGIETYIIDAEASIYDIALNRYYKNYDMFLKGNIGKNGEENIIEQIKDSSNSMYLVKKDGLSLNWQTPTKVINYIKENLKKVETVDIYDIYYKE